VLPSCGGCGYGLGMPARKLPTPQDAAAARRIVLDGLARGADFSELVTELAPLHPRNNTFPGEVFLRLAADVLDACGKRRSPGGRPTTSGNTPCSQRSLTSVPSPTGPVCLCARHASSWPSGRATQRHNHHSGVPWTAVGGSRSPRRTAGIRALLQTRADYAGCVGSVQLRDADRRFSAAPRPNPSMRPVQTC